MLPPVSSRSCAENARPLNSHDTLADEPVSHVALGPLGVGSVLGFKVVVLHKIDELVSGSGLGVDDAVLDEPVVDGRGGPGIVDRVGSLQVGDLDVVEQSSSSGGFRGRDDIVLLEPRSELVVIPGGKDIVLGVIELLCGLGRSVSSLGREGLVAGRGLAVGRRDRGRGLIGGVAVNGGRSRGSPVMSMPRAIEGIKTQRLTGSLREQGAVHGWTLARRHLAQGGIPSAGSRTI